MLGPLFLRQSFFSMSDVNRYTPKLLAKMIISQECPVKPTSGSQSARPIKIRGNSKLGFHPTDTLVPPSRYSLTKISLSLRSIIPINKVEDTLRSAPHWLILLTFSLSSSVSFRCLAPNVASYLLERPSFKSSKPNSRSRPAPPLGRASLINLPYS